MFNPHLLPKSKLKFAESQFLCLTLSLYIDQAKMEFFNLLNKETVIKIQKFITIGFLSISIGLLILSIIAVGLAWYNAFQDGMIPGNMGTYEGNHGPWRHYYPGRTLINYTIIFQLKSFFCALISLFFKRTRLGVWLAIISFLILIIIFYSHYWLID